MSLYSDLLARKGNDTSLDKLVVISAEKAMQLLLDGAPKDYVDFLSEIGAGELGKSDYMIYDGLVDPEEIFGVDVKGLDGIVFFGDDFQGVNSGFRVLDWKVVEVDSVDMHINFLNKSFQIYLREKITEIL